VFGSREEKLANKLVPVTIEILPGKLLAPGAGAIDKMALYVVPLELLASAIQLA
jgi:hypothetical protein